VLHSEALDRCFFLLFVCPAGLSLHASDQMEVDYLLPRRSPPPSPSSTPSAGLVFFKASFYDAHMVLVPYMANILGKSINSRTLGSRFSFFLNPVSSHLLFMEVNIFQLLDFPIFDWVQDSVWLFWVWVLDFF